MKRVIFLFSILALFLVLMACSKGEEELKAPDDYYWGGSTLEATVKVGDRVLARCYDEGAGASSGFFILMGSLSYQDYGENCTTFVSLQILDIGQDIVFHKCCADRIPVGYALSTLPTQGTVLISVSEALVMLKPGSTMQGFFKATMDSRPPTWDYFHILTVKE